MSSVRRIILGSVLLTSGLSLAKANSVSLDLSAAQGYNLLTWGNASLLNSDTQGRVAIGGNATFNSYSIGNAAGITNPSTPALVVGGTLTAGNGNVYEGSIDVGGAYAGPSYSINSAAGSVLEANLGTSGIPFIFSTAYNVLESDSQLYGAQAANGTSIEQWSTLTLTGTNSTLDIFDISASLLQSASTVTINAPSGAQVLINVSGTDVTMSNKGFNGTFDSDANTLFNFYQATTLDLSGIGIDGSVLAPLANVDFASGQLNGELIAASFTGDGELHQDAFNNPIAPASVPDATNTAGLLGAVLLAGACWAGVKSQIRA
jgi:choice-of-anchor A domain-containing protein